MYQLHHSLQVVKGIGESTAEKLSQRGITTIKDLLLYVPLRYEDRSKRVTIDQLVPGELVTLEAEVIRSSNYYKGRRSIQSAQVKDETGRLKLMWFNTPFVIDRLTKGQTFLFSGKLNEKNTMVQPTVEAVSSDTIHTDRLVPVYSSELGVKIGTVRRTLKHILDNLTPNEAELDESWSGQLLSLSRTVKELHFPSDEDLLLKAQERLAIEELLALMSHSKKIKAEWSNNGSALCITAPKQPIPDSLPFTLTGAQLRATDQILEDLQHAVPMNRLLIGDVGSGKTAVAGIACHHIFTAGGSSALIAPTQLLAQQHAETFAKLFPDIPTTLITGKTSKNVSSSGAPQLFIGTHAVINKLSQLKPALVIYDEQHRFGVVQRSQPAESNYYPHTLTMSATPIPRTMMLTIFSHLSVSSIDEMPAGRIPTKTWLVPESKRASSYQWLAEQTTTASSLALIVCPFISPSSHPGFDNVAAVTERFESLKAFFSDKTSSKQPAIEMLHGKLSQSKKDTISKKLYAGSIDILVTTPIVEVGLDIPTASCIVIEGAERFGLASLHQLRGRVGRAGQQGYCLLFTTKSEHQHSERLTHFTQESSGLKVAEYDLKNRGAGDIFGTQQHGLNSLRFADWANLETITTARQLFEKLPKNWSPFIVLQTTSASPADN